MKTEIIAVGKMRAGPIKDLCAEYSRRIRPAPVIREIESRKKDPAQALPEETAAILAALSPGAFIVALDERGKTFKSLDLAKKLSGAADNGTGLFQFVIGGADGLDESVRARADLLLAFGAQTWPHMLARAMLLEQIYRVQQIIAGHPYHREG